MRSFFLFFIFLMVSPVTAWALEDQCAFHGAEYVPQGQAIAESYDPVINLVNRTLSFVMRMEAPDPDCHASELCRFFYIDAYNKAGHKVSTMRLGENWSLGVSRQYFSNYYGQFGDPDTEWSEKIAQFSFNPIGVNKELRPASIQSVPQLIILENTFQKIKTSIQDPEGWDRYIKFYTEDRVYPDFRGYDFWERRACGPADKISAKKQDETKETMLMCGGVSSRIISVCENKRGPLCQSQDWYVASKQINLKADFPDDFRVSGWLCAEDGDKSYVIMQAHNGGNCEECERYMMWTADGDYVAGWRNFWPVFREKNFPAYQPTLSSKMQRVIVSGAQEKP